MTVVTLRFESFAVSHTGHVRSANEDAYSFNLDSGIFVVCDGMGGQAGGGVASQSAVTTFTHHLTPLARNSRAMRTIEQAVMAANRQIYGRTLQEIELQGMGTTLVGIVAQALGKVAIVHVGDSRGYRLRAGQLEQLTEDHSLIAEQIRNGILTEEQADASPMRNVITRAVGVRRTVIPEVRSVRVENGDLFLLCSDGLTREVPEAEIAAILANPADLESQAHALVQAALDHGGHDNVTVILVRAYVEP